MQKDVLQCHNWFSTHYLHYLHITLLFSFTADGCSNKVRVLTRTFMVELAGDCDAGDGVVAGFIPSDGVAAVAGGSRTGRSQATPVYRDRSAGWQARDRATDAGLRRPGPLPVSTAAGSTGHTSDRLDPFVCPLLLDPLGRPCTACIQSCF